MRECPRCHFTYPPETFKKNTRCESCNRLYTIEKQHEFKLACMSYKGGTCVDCGEVPHLCCANFLHMVSLPTNRKINRMVSSAELRPDVIAELDKTELLCRNCLRIRSAGGKCTPQKLRCVEYKGGVCEVCDFNVAAAMEFHHLDPAGKSFTIGDISPNGKRMDEVLAELDKCVLVCANCHALEHFLQKESERNKLRLALNLI